MLFKILENSAYDQGYADRKNPRVRKKKKRSGDDQLKYDSGWVKATKDIKDARLKRKADNEAKAKEIEDAKKVAKKANIAANKAKDKVKDLKK